MKKDNPPKIGKILFAETLNKYYNPYENWYFPLKRACKEIVSFDVRWNHYIYGKEKMNSMFLEFVKKEKPDYIFLWVRSDEFAFNTLLKIREISPNTLTLIFFGDDDAGFENFSRHLILFIDYGLIAQERFLNEYKKEGIKNVFSIVGCIDTSFFKPLNIEKKYDVTFIGQPKTAQSERDKYIKFLKDKGINIRLFGWGWDDYEEFKDFYGGALDADKMVEVLNQSKINLCFSKNHYGLPHLKAKVFEGSACKTFVLTEYFEDYCKLFKEGKEIVFFKDKEDLLEKINYYLKHETEREKIANAAYKRIIKDYSLDKYLENIFKFINLTNKQRKHPPLPEINKKAICLKKEDMKDISNLREKIKEFDYVYFLDKNSVNLEYREYIQMNSLVKSGKPISCCDYYLNSKFLGDYLRVYCEAIIKLHNVEEFNSLLILNQLMVRKDYFLENINLFKKMFATNKIDFLTEENTSMVTFPLIRIKKMKTKSYKTMKGVSYFNFLFDLLSLMKKKKLFFSVYTYALIIEILKGKTFIIKAILNSILDKDKRKKINSFNS